MAMPITAGLQTVATPRSLVTFKAVVVGDGQEKPLKRLMRIR